MGDLSKNFSRHEFLCKGENCHPSGKGNCGFDTVDAELLQVLENIRTNFGMAVHINSGCRCESHNDREGGSHKSQHLYGRAADFFINGVNSLEIVKYLDSKYPNKYGVGLYLSWVHIDTRSSGPARWG